eukprot:CAMPEP_0206488610 /NCGR_PEP_ID=MMETSP0324_2-20121206/42557_1 /ASSEMBLY_ACC=CAM_ASM_000836 /TAXON_ID=2866 /ORGANISM="Crypthecodinium cohnii, Strain Seligo" /LENGTH=66 /DNA_ID=CAMNT_0053967751 /DNA_START=66 /DNA_END=263 /DNA_ORIENTATION=+
MANYRQYNQGATNIKGCHKAANQPSHGWNANLHLSENRKSSRSKTDLAWTQSESGVHGENLEAARR